MVIGKKNLPQMKKFGNQCSILLIFCIFAPQN